MSRLLLYACLALTPALASCRNAAEDAETIVTLCPDCGVAKGAEGCCDSDAQRCDCGKIKGSPGCCADS